MVDYGGYSEEKMVSASRRFHLNAEVGCVIHCQGWGMGSCCFVHSPTLSILAMECYTKQGRLACRGQKWVLLLERIHPKLRGDVCGEGRWTPAKM